MPIAFFPLTGRIAMVLGVEIARAALRVMGRRFNHLIEQQECLEASLLTMFRYPEDPGMWAGLWEVARSPCLAQYEALCDQIMELEGYIWDLIKLLDILDMDLVAENLLNSQEDKLIL